MKKSIAIIVILSVILIADSYSCTIIMVSDSTCTLAGSNEDSAFPLTLLWFVPATDGNYGRVCLGNKMMMNSIQGGIIYVYNYHDFSHPIQFKLAEELRKGNNEYYLGKLFTERNEDYKIFIDEGPANMIEFGYSRINKNVAMMFFNILKFQYPKAFNRDIDMNALSQTGLWLVEQGKLEDAIMFLERNKVEFPDSARAHFELANVYLKSNSKEKAIAEYKETLLINPDHKEAIQALEDLLQQ